LGCTGHLYIALLLLLLLLLSRLLLLYLLLDGDINLHAVALHCCARLFDLLQHNCA
jgi:hypothetical protein